MNEQELRRREAALREKEAELARREQQLAGAQQNTPPGSTAAAEQPGAAAGPASPRPEGTVPGSVAGPGPANAKERLYDRIHIPLWLLDAIIVGCIIAFFVVVAVGALKGHGLL